MNTPSRQTSKEADLLLAWYDINARSLPWRVAPQCIATGTRPDPYRIWLSEIMLQQTQVKTVGEYYHKFLSKWPQLSDLARCEPEEVLKAWAGLGYYSRARNLKKCADIVAAQFGGKFPDKSSALAKLPGIGPYTSAAIAAIAFNEPVAVVDGNAERVVTRLVAMLVALPKAKSEIRKLVQAMVPTHRPGDFAQAMMDLGARVCIPVNPQCQLCPLGHLCKAKKLSRQNDFPVKMPKKKVPERFGAVFVAISSEQKILLRKRKDKGMLAGMSELPSTNWSAQEDGETEISAAPFANNWQSAGKVQHQFTHFKLVMYVYWCRTQPRADVDGWWVAEENVLDEALPVLFRKALNVAQRAIEVSIKDSENEKN